MLRDITIGQYYDVDSVIHRLDARLKLLVTFLFVLFLFLFDSMLTMLPVTLLLGLVIKISNVKLKFILKGLKPVLLIIIFTVIMNMIFTPGDIIFEFYFIKISKQGVIRALFMGYRLFILIISSSMMTYTTSPIELTDAIEGLLKPFKKIGVPSHEIAMIMSMALRYIPTLLEETDKIIKAQTARGAKFDSKKLTERAKSYIPVLVPLFVNSFRRAEDLAMAMESRCYRGDIGRTRLKVMKFTRVDYIVAGLCLFAFLCLFVFDFYTAKSVIWNIDINVK